MLIFKQISSPDREAVAGPNRRKSARYIISPTFPLKVVVRFIERGTRVSVATGTANGKVATAAPGTVAKEWSGTPVDLSATGANIHLSLAAVAFPDDVCRVRFSLGGFQLELPAVVVHFRCGAQFAMCGLQFNFPDAETEKAYFQLLEPVMIGTSLAPVAARPDNTGRHTELYAGKNSALLTIWRQAPGGDIISFDFRMNQYGVRLSSGHTELIPYGLEPEKPAAAAKPVLKLKLKTPEKPGAGAATIPLSEAQDEEVRWLFCLAVSNLSPAVAADARKFLLSLVVA